MARTLSAVAFSLFLIAAAAPEIGQIAPDFTLLDQNGKTVALDAARGHKAVLVFYRGYW